MYNTCMGDNSFKKIIKRCWKDGSEIKRNGYSSGELSFDTKQPHGSSQLTITPVPGDLISYSDLCRHQSHM